MNIAIRDAGPGDAAAIATIYNDAVANGNAICNERLVERARAAGKHAMVAAMGAGNACSTSCRRAEAAVFQASGWPSSSVKLSRKVK